MQRGHAPIVHAVHGQGDVLDDEGHADRGDQDRQTRCRAQPAVGEELDRRIDQRPEDRRDHERREEPSDDDERGRLLVEMEDAHDPGAREEPAQREDVAVGEVDQLQDAVDERVAESDERVDRARRQTDQEDVEEVIASSVIPEDEVVLDGPEEDQNDEEHPEHGRDRRASPILKNRERAAACSGLSRDSLDSRTPKEGRGPPSVARLRWVVF